MFQKEEMWSRKERQRKNTEGPKRGAKGKKKILRRALKGHLKTKKEGKEKWHKRAIEKKRKPGYFSWKEEATEVCLNFLFFIILCD